MDTVDVSKLSNNLSYYFDVELIQGIERGFERARRARALLLNPLHVIHRVVRGIYYVAMIAKKLAS